MDKERILEIVRSFEGVLVLAPEPGSEFPEISWGDSFIYYAPDGQVPTNVQPYATIVTKDYPDDTQSRLDDPGRWRVNIHVGQDRLDALTADGGREFAAADVFLPHPVYGALGWVCVVNPGEQTTDAVLALLREAHDDARRRFDRRARLHAPENPDA